MCKVVVGTVRSFLIALVFISAVCFHFHTCLFAPVPSPWMPGNSQGSSSMGGSFLRLGLHWSAGEGKVPLLSV